MHDRNQIPIRSESLPKRLRRAVTDKYDRTKAPKRACYRPYNKKDTPAAGKPNIHIADESHKKRLCKYLASAR